MTEETQAPEPASPPARPDPADAAPPDQQLHALWRAWSANALPPNAPMNQRAQLRLAFTCGAMLSAARVLSAPSPEEAQSRLERLYAEAGTFIKVVETMREGRA